MKIISSVASMIDKYGNSVVIHGGKDDVSTKAFVEPLRYKNKIYIGGRKHALGMFNSEKYLYIGKPGDRLVEDVSVVECGEDKYIVKRQETYRVCGEAVYVWAVMTRHRELTEDEYDSDKTSFGYDY